MFRLQSSSCRSASVAGSPMNPTDPLRIIMFSVSAPTFKPSGSCRAARSLTVVFPAPGIPVPITQQGRIGSTSDASYGRISTSALTAHNLAPGAHENSEDLLPPGVRREAVLHVERDSRPAVACSRGLGNVRLVVRNRGRPQVDAADAEPRRGFRDVDARGEPGCEAVDDAGAERPALFAAERPPEP